MTVSLGVDSLLARTVKSIPKLRKKIVREEEIKIDEKDENR